MPKQQAKRKYDNTARADKSAKTQQSIVEALVTLLVERRGGEVQVSEIAKRTGITERTIFRFFKDKKTLHEAMDAYLLRFLQASTGQMQSMDFIGFAKNAYRLFDEHESLAMAYVLSPFGQEARAIFRKKLNQLMIARIHAERKFELTDQRRRRLALVIALVNAKIWYDCKVDFGFSGKQMGEEVEWALQTLLNAI